MIDIFDEALKEYQVVYFGAMPTVVKALKLGKLYKELAECREELLQIDVDSPTKHRESERQRYVTFKRFVQNILKEIEAIENEF